jgi:hypothetical protein
MSKWIDFSLAERNAMIQRITLDRNIDEVSAEKDWWVTAVLYALFHTSVSPYLLFKGGTSLSKGWNIISRFSEDIDLALDRSFFLDVKGEKCANCTSRTQIHHLREKGHDFILGDLKEELQNKLSQMGLKDVVVTNEDEEVDETGKTKTTDHDKDPSVIFVKYPSLYSSHESYAMPVVKVEISVLSMAEPYEVKRISSLINQVYSAEGINVDEDFTMDIKTVSPARTFLEKAFLLCEEFQKDNPRTRRMTRHFYDLEKLSHTEYADKALSDVELYKAIVAHRDKFYHVGYVDYAKELPAVITILPPEALRESYETDYKAMQRSFIYADSLPFNELMDRLSQLQERFRHINLMTDK